MGDIEWRRFVTDEEAEGALPPPRLDDPVAVGMLFVNGLADESRYRDTLEQLVTPESLDTWGDFSAAAGFLAGIEDVGYGSIADPAVGAPDVRYFKILGGVAESFQVLDEQPVAMKGVITLVWRGEFGRWMVHGIGDYIRPERVPRST